MSEILFRELEKKLTNYKGSKNLLLGNGFNLSIPNRGNDFQYSSIIPSHNINGIIKTLKKDLNPIQQKIKQKIDYDLEKIIDIIEVSKRNIIDEFTKNFVAKHAKYSEFKQYIAGLAEFIKKYDFSNLFTVNYDLILYWTILYYNDHYFKNKLSSREYVDGFWRSKLISEPLEQQMTSSKRAIGDSRKTFKPNLFYLHGAIYLFRGKHNKPKKIKKAKEYKNFKDSRRLQDYIKDNIEEHDFPLIILEGNSETKKAKLENDPRYSPYGIFCMNAFRAIDGLLLIYGCSFEHDQHILEALKSNSNLDKLLITFTEDSTKTAILSYISDPAFQNKITWVKVDIKNSHDNIWRIISS